MEPILLRAEETFHTTTIKNNTEKPIILEIRYTEKCIDPQTHDVEYSTQDPVLAYLIPLQPGDQKNFRVEPMSDRVADTSPIANVNCIQDVQGTIKIDGKTVLQNQELDAGGYEFKSSKTGYTLDKIY